MKTEQLIAAMVAAGAPPGRRLARRLALAVVGAELLSLGVFLLVLGPREDLAVALGTWRFYLKVGEMVLALALASWLCLTLARPVLPAHPGRRLLPLLVIAALAVATELIVVPSSAWGTRLVGTNSLVCLTAIPLLSLAPLAAALLALRAGAPASPALAGAMAGLLAAACGATLYAFHCFDDSPLFVATWYTLAALPVVIVGAVAGHRLMRW
jgi:hypothetical protein